MDDRCERRPPEGDRIGLQIDPLSRQTHEVLLVSNFSAVCPRTGRNERVSDITRRHELDAETSADQVKRSTTDTNGQLRITGSPEFKSPSDTR
jgi:hypothetical protein